jgi:hypothetical protein
MFKHTIQLKSGNTLTIEQIDAQLADKLLEQLNGKILTEYSSDTCEYYYYLLEDNRVVHCPAGPDRYLCYPFEAFVEYKENNSIFKKIVQSDEVEKVVVLPGCERIYIKKVAQQRLSEMVPEDELVDAKDGILHLNDGRVVEYGNFGLAFIYRNESDFSKVREFNRSLDLINKEYRQRGDKVIIDSSLCCINRYGLEFEKHIGELVSELGEIVNAPKSVFDYSLNSLSRLDWFLYKPVIDFEYRSKVFLPLLAYIGATYLNTLRGEWVYLKNLVCQDWIPDVRQKDGEYKMLYHPINQILDPESGHGDYITLREVYRHVWSRPI